LVLAPAAEISRGKVNKNRASLEAGRRLDGDKEGAEEELEGRGDEDEEREPESEGEVEADAGCALLRGPSSPEREEGAGKPPSPLVAPRGGGRRRAGGKESEVGRRGRRSVREERSRLRSSRSRFFRYLFRFPALTVGRRCEFPSRIPPLLPLGSAIQHQQRDPRFKWSHTGARIGGIEGRARCDSVEKETKEKKNDDDDVDVEKSRARFGAFPLAESTRRVPIFSPWLVPDKRAHHVPESLEGLMGNARLGGRMGFVVEGGKAVAAVVVVVVVEKDVEVIVGLRLAAAAAAALLPQLKDDDSMQTERCVSESKQRGGGERAETEPSLSLQQRKAKQASKRKKARERATRKEVEIFPSSTPTFYDFFFFFVFFWSRSNPPPKAKLSLFLQLSSPLLPSNETFLSFTMALSARAFAPACAASGSSSSGGGGGGEGRSIMPMRRGIAPRVAARQPLSASPSSEPPSTSGRRTVSVPQRRRQNDERRRRPLPCPPAAEGSSSSSSSTPRGAEPLEPGAVIKELPLFPLNLVAFPHADVPLHIFEARWEWWKRERQSWEGEEGRRAIDRMRGFSFFFSSSSHSLTSLKKKKSSSFSSLQTSYRVLFSTLLSGDKDIDEGMVSADKAWLGTRSFGLWWVKKNGGVFFLRLKGKKTRVWSLTCSDFQ
jgi:hypothetical protein